MEKKRELWLDYAKAVTCIMVVIIHVLNGLIQANILSDKGIFMTLELTIFQIPLMPIFFMISGYFYKKKEKISNLKNYLTFIRKKIINLGIPYIFFSIIFTFLNMITSDVNDKLGILDIITIYKHPISHLWFLYTLMVIFILIPILEKVLKKEKILIATLLIIKIIVSFIPTKLISQDLFFISSFCNYAIYFYLGYWIINFIQNNSINKNILYKLVTTLIFIILVMIKQEIDKNILIIIDIVIGIYGSYIFLILISGIKNNNFLDLVGNNFFQIYLMHTIFAAGIRTILLKIGIINGLVYIIIGLVSGIFMPIIVSLISNKLLITNIVIFPLNTWKQIKEKNYE